MVQDTLHHIPDDVLDAAPKQMGMTDWQPSSDLPRRPAKRQRSNDSPEWASMVAEQADHVGDEAVKNQPNHQGKHAVEHLSEDSTTAQDDVLLERGDCAAAAPIAA